MKINQMKINSVILIAEDLDLENSSNFPTHIYFNDSIKINNAVIISNDNNKTIIEGIIDSKEKHSYFNVKEAKAISDANPDEEEFVSEIKPKSRPSTKEEIELISNYIKSKYNNPLELGLNEEDGDFTTYILGENNLLVIMNSVFVEYYKSMSPQLFTSQERYYIKYGIVYPIENDTEVDDLEEDITEITNII